MSENTTTMANASALLPHGDLTTTSSLSTADAPSDTHKVNIAVVDNSSVNVVKQPLPTTDAWTEEFDHLTNLVTILEDTVTSMASLNQINASPEPHSSSRTSPDTPSSSHVYPNATDGIFLIKNQDVTSPAIPLQSAVSQSVVSQDGQDDVSSEDNTSSQDNESSQVIQVGNAKRADNFVPKMYIEKKMSAKDEEEDEAEQVCGTNWVDSPYNTGPPPDYFLSNTTSSCSDVGHELNKPVQTMSEGNGDVEFDADFIELLQFGESADLHMD